MVIVVPIVGIAAISCIVMARTFSRREREQALPPRQYAPVAPTEFDARLERVAQAVDVIASELDKISENQRALTKVLADQAPAAQRIEGRGL